MAAPRHTPPTVEVYSETIDDLEKHSAQSIEDLRTQAPEFLAVSWSRVLRDSLLVLRQRYSRGDPIASLTPSVDTVVTRYVRATVEIGPGEHHVWRVGGELHELCTVLAFALALDLPGDRLHSFLGAVGQSGKCGLWDRLTGALGSGPASIASAAALAAQYGGLVEAIDAPADRRPRLVAAYLSKWLARMKSFPWSNAATRADWSGHGLWSWEVACSVMIFDIDDTSFRDHKHYPRDLVDHFRAQGTRLAARMSSPPAAATAAQRQRAPIPKRSSQAETWLAYVVEGDDAEVAAALKAWPEQVTGYDSVICALEVLQSRGHALRVDVKDAAEAVAQAARMARARRLEGDVFDLPTKAVEPTLAALDRWFEARGYRLLDVETDADEYAAVAVRAELLDEAMTLGRALNLAVEPAAARFGRA